MVRPSRSPVADQDPVAGGPIRPAADEDGATGGAGATGDEDAPRLVLASASPRRRELLARLGLHPAIRPADVDESVHPGESAADLVVRLALTKAVASAAAGRHDRGHALPTHDVSGPPAREPEHPHDDEVVLAADTEVVLAGQVLGKPRDDAEAVAMLDALSGRTHEVITGLAVVRGDTHRTGRVTTSVTFRTLSADEIAWYVATGEPDGKAGAYALQGAGAVLVQRLEGSDTNVIGLPLAETVALLRRVGLDVLRAGPRRH